MSFAGRFYLVVFVFFVAFMVIAALNTSETVRALAVYPGLLALLAGLAFVLLGE